MARERAGRGELCCALSVLEIEIESEREREPGERREEVTVWRQRCGSTDIHRHTQATQTGCRPTKNPGYLGRTRASVCGDAPNESWRTHNPVMPHTESSHNTHRSPGLGQAGPQVDRGLGGI